MDSENEPFLEEKGTVAREVTAKPQSNMVVIVALVLSIVVNLFFVYLQPCGRMLRNVRVECASITTEYNSPIADDVTIAWDTVEFNGSFLQETIYRQPPSPEVDAAWDAIGVNARPIVVSEDIVEPYGLQPGMVKRKQEQGGGYMVLVEGFHHLHCLDLLRQSTWFNYDYYLALGKGPFTNTETDLKKHVGHCMDILRQQLMCTVDISLFGQWWVKDVGPFVDFNTKHKCKNFDEIKQWVMDHQITEDSPDRVVRRPGDKLLPTIP